MDWNTLLRAVVSLIGLLLCFYTLHVEIHSASNPDYKAMCDISEHMSCTKAFNSKHGRGFGLVEPILGEESPLNLPNPVYGIGLYSLMFILSFCGSSIGVLKFLTFNALASCVMSVYLAYILYLMKDVCVVCMSTYAVNFSLFALNYRKWGQVAAMQKLKSE